jgi:hypothetical protein
MLSRWNKRVHSESQNLIAVAVNLSVLLTDNELYFLALSRSNQHYYDKSSPSACKVASIAQSV